MICNCFLEAFVWFQLWLHSHADVVLSAPPQTDVVATARLPAGAFQQIFTVLRGTEHTHLMSVLGETPQPVTRATGTIGRMSLTPMNGG